MDATCRATPSLWVGDSRESLRSSRRWSGRLVVCNLRSHIKRSSNTTKLNIFSYEKLLRLESVPIVFTTAREYSFMQAVFRPVGLTSQNLGMRAKKVYYEP